MNKVDIGHMYEVVELCRVTISRGTKGEKVETVVCEARVHASVEQQINEVVEDYNQAPKTRATIHIYRHPEISTYWKIRWKGRLFNILSITPAELAENFMEIEVEEV